jgi:ubiquinone biosynthesis protein
LQVIREAFALIYSMNIRLPTRFVLLDKAIATVGAVGVDLYPDFNVFEVARPYARGLLADRYQPRVVAQRLKTEAVALSSVARDLPYQAHDILEQMRDGSFHVRIENPGIDQLDEHLDQASNRLSVALVVLGGLVGSSIVGVFAEEGPQVMGLHLLSFLGFVLSGAFGIWLMWGVLRHGRL